MTFTDALIVGYLGSHIPITILIDAQSVLPTSFYPQAVRDTLAWYVSWSHDVLMDPTPGAGGMPPWFTAITLAEVLLQLPFFFFALLAWRSRSSDLLPGLLTLRTATMAYGAHVATTLIPIFGVFHSDARCADTKWILTAIYMPYFVVPLLMLVLAAETGSPFSTTTTTTTDKPTRPTRAKRA
jgi:hypothetical protein